MDFNMREELSLSNFARGELEKDFQQYYREIMNQIKDKEKGTISISLTFQRIENTDMMVDTSYSIKKTIPAKATKAMAILTEKGLFTEKPKEPPVKLVSMFKEEGGNE